MLQVDRLYEAVAEKSPVCVGLDTDFSYIPAECVDKTLSKGENIFRFNRDIIEATRSVAGCFKVQIAYYEALGLDGMLAYKSTLEYLRREGLVAIADIKRGDIAKTAEMYAKAHLDGEFEADFVTLAPYMGLDSITPYTKYMTEKGKGVFVLCRTSNPGAKDYEYEKLADGRHVYDLVGDKLSAMARTTWARTAIPRWGSSSAAHTSKRRKRSAPNTGTAFPHPGLRRAGRHGRGHRAVSGAGQRRCGELQPQRAAGL